VFFFIFGYRSLQSFLSKPFHGEADIVNPLERRGNYSATSNDNEVGTLAVDRWAVTFGTARRGLGGAAARPGPSSLAVPNVTASVPVTVFLRNGPLLCGFNVPIKG